MGSSEGESHSPDGVRSRSRSAPADGQGGYYPSGHGKGAPIERGSASAAWPAPRGLAEWELGLQLPWIPRCMRWAGRDALRGDATWPDHPATTWHDRVGRAVARAMRLPLAPPAPDEAARHKRRAPVPVAAAPQAFDEAAAERTLAVLHRLPELAVIVGVLFAPLETVGLALLAIGPLAAIALVD